MKVNKKASAKAIEFIAKLTKKEYPKSTSWEEVFNILTGTEFTLDIGAYCESQGDKTEISIYQNHTNNIWSESFKNPDMWDEKTTEFNWNAIYKTCSEILMKNWRKLHSKQRKKKS